MGEVRRAANGLASSISVEQFEAALLRVWRPRTSRRGPARIGVAVSGGVDSMALATLCGQLQDQKPAQYSFKAFVVDHQARANSDKEANGVLDRLRSLHGITAEMLKLQWPDGVQPLRLENFETEARTKRFQALGGACLRNGIDSLLLGHHADDQAETVLMRIVSGYMGSGLAAIKERARIPACHGLYGIHEQQDQTSRSLVRSSKRFEPPTAVHGITVHRPLLQYSKQDLQKTCNSFKVAWVEDETNQDPTSNLRNAVRHLLHNRELPVALQKQSLLALQHARQTSSLAAKSKIVDLSRRKRMWSIDTRTGKLSLRIPILFYSTDADRPHGGRDAGSITTLIQHVAEMVSPKAQVSSEDARKIEERIHELQTSPEPAKPFTLAGIFWSPGHPFKSPSDDSWQWVLSREPFFRSTQMPLCKWTSSPGSTTDPNSEHKAVFGNWVLFDQRFWLRVWSQETQVVARPLRTTDMDHLMSKLPRWSSAKVKETLREAAPDKLRYTLPVLVDPIRDAVLAMPTLGLKLPGSPEELRWQVLYRNTDWRVGNFRDNLQKQRPP